LLDLAFSTNLKVRRDSGAVRCHIMIRGFEPAQPLPPEPAGPFQWGAAIGAGLIAGVILLIVPHGDPWAGITFFAPVIMGRDLMGQAASLWATTLMHIGLAVVYGLIISVAVRRTTQLWALIIGALIGLVLYGINFGVVSVWFSNARGNELSVAFTHLVFGAIAGGTYRGLLRRKPANSP